MVPFKFIINPCSGMFFSEFSGLCFTNVKDVFFLLFVTVLWLQKFKVYLRRPVTDKHVSKNMSG